ncbi:MAG TPA: GntR family transcriptional regulator [Solirubrobacteraceae bacterium]|nr:GntR family transcriptional regulator [Solirubrobacteraceae bacterium]
MPQPAKSQVVPRASLSDAVYERLRDEIMHGEIADGSRLSQVELAGRYGVSRIPVREALRRLQAESLVVATPHHPFVVRNVTPEQVVELVDIRAALEDLALSRRGPVTPEELAQLRRINQQMAKAGRGQAWFKLDRELHRHLAGPSTMTIELIDEVRDRVHKYVSSMTSAKLGRATATEEHTNIVDALEAGDVELARAHMSQHVNKSRAFIVNRLGLEGRSGEQGQDVQRQEK